MGGILYVRECNLNCVTGSYFDLLLQSIFLLFDFLCFEVKNLTTGTVHFTAPVVCTFPTTIHLFMFLFLLLFLSSVFLVYVSLVPVFLS